MRVCGSLAAKRTVEEIRGSDRTPTNEVVRKEGTLEMADARSPEEVLDDHLRLRADPHVVLLTSNSNMRGHDALRNSARR
ncbi:hypothetical protein ABID21_001416 [Pseudorhizobium tarimense]|uniref:Uncharacterized protein n=1 Tax=Pseudorhizobium tarimense TaxID=1079109 RepID=A0ABV2H434_9HYPH